MSHTLWAQEVEITISSKPRRFCSDLAHEPVRVSLDSGWVTITYTETNEYTFNKYSVTESFPSEKVDSIRFLEVQHDAS